MFSRIAILHTPRWQEATLIFWEQQAWRRRARALRLLKRIIIAHGESSGAGYARLLRLYRTFFAIQINWTSRLQTPPPVISNSLFGPYFAAISAISSWRSNAAARLFAKDILSIHVPKTLITNYRHIEPSSGRMASGLMALSSL